MGRKAKPEALKALEGNRSKGPAGKRVSLFPTSVPACPRHLDPSARAEWTRITKILAGAKLMTAADRAALACYCAAWSRWVEAQQHIRRGGCVIKMNGIPCQSPWLKIEAESMRQMKGFLIEFGLTPASRPKLSGAGVNVDEDPLSSFLED